MGGGVTIYIYIYRSLFLLPGLWRRGSSPPPRASASLSLSLPLSHACTAYLRLDFLVHDIVQVRQSLFLRRRTLRVGKSKSQEKWGQTRVALQDSPAAGCRLFEHALCSSAGPQGSGRSSFSISPCPHHADSCPSLLVASHRDFQGCSCHNREDTVLAFRGAGSAVRNQSVCRVTIACRCKHSRMLSSMFPELCIRACNRILLLPRLRSQS